MNRIKEYRKKYGYNQITLASMCNISQGTLSAYENGRYEPDQQILKKLAKIFNTTIDSLLYNDVPDTGKPIAPQDKYGTITEEAFALAVRYDMLNPSAQAVVRSVIELELKQDTYMKAEVERRIAERAEEIENIHETQSVSKV